MDVQTTDRSWTRLAACTRAWSIDDAWVAIACLLPFAAAALGPTPSGDLAYQVRSGDWMLRTHELLRADVFTFTVRGHGWLNQQWAAAVLLALLNRAGGWSAVAVARALLVFVAFRTTYLLARRRSGDRRLSARLTIAAFVVAALFPGALAARAQMFVLPMFSLSCVLVAERGEHPARLWLLPLVTLAWANLHGSFFLPATVLGCAIVGDALSKRSVDVRGLAVCAACVAAAGVGPFGLGVYGYVASLPRNPVVSGAVDEWQPLGVTPAGIAFAACAVAIGLGVLRRRLAFRPAELIGVVAFSVLAAATGRAVVWWALIVPPLVSTAVTRVEQRPRPRPAGEPASTVVVVALASLALVAAVHAATVGRAFLTDAPAGITRFLAERVDRDARTFDGWWGSWFEYALPGRPMFVDARAELFPERVWADYFDVSRARPGWDGTLRRWSIDVVVASPDHQAALIAALRRSATWRQAYGDSDGSIFVRSRCGCVAPASGASG